MTALPSLGAELVKRLDVPGPRYTSYPTVPLWTDGFDGDAYRAALEEAAEVEAEPLGLYVHIPFCRERCTFCGCNVVIAKDPARADAYLDQVAREMTLVAGYLGRRRGLSQVHWGGGTPTFLNEAQIARLWGTIREHFQPGDEAEVSIEVDPMATTESQLALLAELGFNRISFGVQDFDPRVQDAINRPQSVVTTRRMMETARELGFGSVNFDLIHGLPHQTPESWARTIETVLSMRPDRLAVYSFAYVPDVRPHQRRLPMLGMPTGLEKLNLFKLAYETLLDGGYAPIGMDHFALPDDELSVAQRERRLGRNFQGYTIRAAADVVAFGVTAISDVRGRYAQNYPQLGKYGCAVGEDRLATVRGITTTADDRRRRAIITSLMCNFWVDLGPDAETEMADELARLSPMQEEGLLTIDGSEIELTPLGRLFVRNVAMVFDSYLDKAGATFSRTV